MKCKNYFPKISINVGYSLCYFILLKHLKTLLDAKKIGTEVFGELRNVVLEENGEDKMVR